MYSLVHNLSSVAQAADQELRLAGQRPDKLGDCGDQLRKCFAVSLQAPGKVCTWPVVAVPHGLTHMVLRAACTGARQPLQGTNMVQHTATSCLGAGHREKKLAALDIVNASIKIYFRLNTLRLCKNLMRTVESRQFAAFDSFPMSQRVTYQFYSGRLAVFDENYVSSACLCGSCAPGFDVSPAQEALTCATLLRLTSLLRHAGAGTAEFGICVGALP